MERSLVSVGANSRVLDTHAAAAYIGCSAAALRLWKRQGRGPRFYRAGRLVRYRKEDLDTWVRDHSEGGDNNDSQNNKNTDR
jgi:hypothetical protein